LLGIAVWANFWKWGVVFGWWWWSWDYLGIENFNVCGKLHFEGSFIELILPKNLFPLQGIWELCITRILKYSANHSCHAIELLGYGYYLDRDWSSLQIWAGLGAVHSSCVVVRAKHTFHSSYLSWLVTIGLAK